MKNKTIYHGTYKGNRFERFDLKKAYQGVGSNVCDHGKQIYLTENKGAAVFFSIWANDKHLLSTTAKAYYDAKKDENTSNEELKRLYDDMSMASTLTGQPGEVLEFSLSKDAKIKYLDFIPRAGAIKNGVDPIIDSIKNEGFDGVSYPERGFYTVEGIDIRHLYDGETPPRTVIIFNQDVLTLIDNNIDFAQHDDESAPSLSC